MFGICANDFYLLTMNMDLAIAGLCFVHGIACKIKASFPELKFIDRPFVKLGSGRIYPNFNYVS